MLTCDSSVVRITEAAGGRVKGHLLWRVSNGTFYETWLPFVSDPGKEILYIEVLEDRETYNVWEITTEDKIYYVDAGNGVINSFSQVLSFIELSASARIRKLIKQFWLKIFW